VASWRDAESVQERCCGHPVQRCPDVFL